MADIHASLTAQASVQPQAVCAFTVGESDDAVRNFCVVAEIARAFRVVASERLQRARTAAVAVNRGGGANGTVPHASRRKSSPRAALAANKLSVATSAS